MLKWRFLAVTVTVSTLFLIISKCEYRPYSCSSTIDGCNKVTEISECASDPADCKQKHLVHKCRSSEDVTWLSQSEVALTAIESSKEHNRTWTGVIDSSEFSQTKALSTPVLRGQCHFGEGSVELKLQNVDGQDSRQRCSQLGCNAEETPLCSSATMGPWSHSLFALIHPFANGMLQEGGRRSVPRHKNVDTAKEFPLVTFFLLINNTGTPAAADLSQLDIRDSISPNHSVHFAGFIGAFLLSALVVCLGLPLITWIQAAFRKKPLQQRKNRAILSGDGDPEYATCNISETAKEEAAFEDKMVDIMVLEDPQNMYQALENLDMSNLLRAAASLESIRVQIHKDVIAALLRGLRLRGLLSAQAERRLLSVLQGQLMGMEGKLKEEHVARMAALAAQCNMETRQEMEAEHRREAAEKERAGLLFQHADQQVLTMHCAGHCHTGPTSQNSSADPRSGFSFLCPKWIHYS
ncbi:hypothetical protein JZ751_008637 [Albula glossodonta]|uniref:Uncharacterized protein n=1 Tax=Albula glossodonta TaxID=121402 RepID=A0A8T2NWW2_9TELE|nr:hypothetical protein JZ751_008637 [Albula glossodonta]